MTPEERIRRYAELTVHTGANVAPGQLVHVEGAVEHAPFARAIAEAAYRAGARYVDVWYWDPHPKRSRLLHAPEETLRETPRWLQMRDELLVEEKGASIKITGSPDPNILQGVDPHALQRGVKVAFSAQQHERGVRASDMRLLDAAH